MQASDLNKNSGYSNPGQDQLVLELLDRNSNGTGHITLVKAQDIGVKDQETAKYILGKRLALVSKSQKTRYEVKVLNKMPLGLSAGGQKFWLFMNNIQKASGNRHPRDLPRNKLTKVFEDDLLSPKPARQRFMETDHGFIQWLFPLKDLGTNRQAPIMTEQDHAILSHENDFQQKLFEHFVLFAKFMGIQYNPAQGSFKKVNANQWKSWIENPHNNLRISRVLESLKSFGLGKVSNDFVRFLASEANRNNSETIGKQTFIAFTEETQDSYTKFWSKYTDSSNKAAA